MCAQAAVRAPAHQKPWEPSNTLAARAARSIPQACPGSITRQRPGLRDTPTRQRSCGYQAGRLFAAGLVTSVQATVQSSVHKFLGRVCAGDSWKRPGPDCRCWGEGPQEAVRGQIRDPAGCKFEAPGAEKNASETEILIFLHGWLWVVFIVFYKVFTRNQELQVCLAPFKSWLRVQKTL